MIFNEQDGGLVYIASSPLFRVPDFICGDTVIYDSITHSHNIIVTDVDGYYVGVVMWVHSGRINDMPSLTFILESVTLNMLFKSLKLVSPYYVSPDQ